MPTFNDEQVIQSWHINAKAWTEAIHDQAIESRIRVTNQAIINAVMEYQPATALDLGCGEGWLCRALVAQDVNVTGVDVVPALIDTAKRLGSGAYQCCAYENIAQTLAKQAKFDVAICNFSLIGKTSVELLLQAIPSLLGGKGHLFIQTLHPLLAGGDAPYHDGWREGSWQGFGPQFTSPAPWYFRTIESWKQQLHRRGFKLIECREPIHPDTQKPASMIFICSCMP